MQPDRGVRVDHLQRHLNALRSPEELRRDGDRSLADYVEAERRDLDGDAFALLDKEIHERISNMARSADAHDKRCALLAIAELIDVKYISENSARISNMSRSIKAVIQNTTDAKLLKQAARTMGHLVQSTGALTADVVEREIRDALERLSQRHPQNEVRRLGACYMLRELAENAPAVFNVHVRQFIDVIWNALRDACLEVRLAAVAALRACLILVEQRETRYRVQWWYRLFEQTMRALMKPFNERDIVSYVHASLLALGELLEHTGEFMLARYREAVDTVLQYRESKHLIIKQAVILLIPKIAAFAPEKFALSYLDVCTSHLLRVLSTSQTERGTAFVALGAMAAALARVKQAGQLVQRLPDITREMKEAFESKSSRDLGRRPACMEALQCVGVLAEALGHDTQPHVQKLLQPMILTGLSDALVKSLLKVSKALPELVPDIQRLLLEAVLLALPRRTLPDYSYPYANHGATNGGTSVGGGAPSSCYLIKEARSGPSLRGYSKELQSVLAYQEREDSKRHKITKLALETLIQFDFGRYSLLDFTHDVLVGYMRVEDASIRKAAALAAWKVVERQWGILKDIHGDNEMVTMLGGQKSKVESIIQALLQMVVSDTDVGVRKSIMEHVQSMFAANMGKMETFFAQAESMRVLRICMNDECMAVRNGAITLMGQLSVYNPACVNPTLRRHLHQLLTDIENCLDSKHLDESTQLLSSLIQYCPDLVLPNIAIIQSKLVAKLVEARKRINARSDGKSKSGHSMTTSILKTIGILTNAAAVKFRPYVEDILPLVVEAMCDTRMDSNRTIAVTTLGQLVGSTGMVIMPFKKYPQLLGVLLHVLHDGVPATRRKVVEVLGIIGALDPYTHKQNQALLTGEGKLDKDGVRGAPLANQNQSSKLNDEIAPEVMPANGLMTSSEEFYPTVAINALVWQLRDSKMAPYHGDVVSALMYIFRSLQLGSVTYLPQVLPVLFQVIHVSDEQLQVQIFTQLVDLVQIVQGHMRRYLQDILQLIDRYWSVQRAPLLNILLTLLAQLARALQDDFRQHVSELLPKFVSLFQEAERSGNFAIVEPGLMALQALGLALEDHFHLLLPSLVRLLPTAQSAVVPLRTRQVVLSAMAKLLPRMNLSSYASAVLHPLICTLSHSSGQLQEDALDTICALAVAIGPDMTLFLPTIQEVMRAHNCAPSKRFLRIAEQLTSGKHPCMTDVFDWESASGWAPEMDGVQYNEEMHPPPNPSPNKFPVQQEALRRAWESSQRCTKEDWMEWMRHLSVELLCQSPSPALRACHQLAQLQPSMARELFAAGFVSCWLDIDDTHQQELVRSLEAALASPSIPPEIVTALLNLAEFMEHDERPLPLDTRTLGALAEKCHAFAKALHYKELEFMTSPHTAVEALIHINNQLRQPDAANGMLIYAIEHLQQDGVSLQDSWYEKLQRWDKALVNYAKKLQAEPRGTQEFWEAAMGKMRCLAALAEWDELMTMCTAEWPQVDPLKRREMAPIAAHAAWHMGEWAMMAKFVDAMDSGRDTTTSTGAFLRAVLNVRRGEAYYGQANHQISVCRELLSTELAALVGESYSRAYQDMVRAQQCTELQEVIQYTMASDIRSRSTREQDIRDAEERKELIRNIWRQRIQGVERSVDVWQGLLCVRSLVLPMRDDVDVWLKFAALCRKDSRPRLAVRTLTQLLSYDPQTIAPGEAGFGAGSNAPQVMMAYLKHLWCTSRDTPTKVDVLARLRDLAAELDSHEDLAQISTNLGSIQSLQLEGVAADAHRSSRISGVDLSRTSTMTSQISGLASTSGAAFGARHKYHPPLIAKAYMYLGLWQWHMQTHLAEDAIEHITVQLHKATLYADRWGKAWHHFALFNVAAMTVYVNVGNHEAAKGRVVPAMHAFFQSVALNSHLEGHSNLQDILRLLTLWFSYGGLVEVQEALLKGFSQVPMDTWLVVVPQMMARIHTNQIGIRKLINELLIKIGYHHPQALMYPLLVACKSQSVSRSNCANAVISEIKSHSPVLVDQAMLVSHELIRIAILWHEMWHEGLEDASRLYFGESNVQGMLDTLMPLHDMMRDGNAEASLLTFDEATGVQQPRPVGAVTMSETAFLQAYGNELQEAHEWCVRYKASGRQNDLQQAWDLYYHIFKRIHKQLPTMTTLDLNYVAPALVRAQGLELAVPGTYIAGQPVVTIASFASKLQVISSKQRPRRLTIHGGDGAEYQFLLKGHEDLRQDERVMQLFGLVNNLLTNDRFTAERDLSIARYAVIPLSPNSGLIGWVRNCDTLHALIREYRESRKIPLNVEHRIMQSLAPDYEHLMVIQKVEVFQGALEATSGEDLHKVLWLKSRNSEVWLDRRTAYTRSIAVMSMVGYLLGLGDRHPSNLMLDRYSGKLVHIDFGDCFEASMHREKFPEKVPFRLTRMMIKAMEVSGIEGNFRTTCEQTMTVLRQDKDSVMAMLEAFVHDPLINWRLLKQRDVGAGPESTNGRQEDAQPDRVARERELFAHLRQVSQSETGLQDANEALNERAVTVMKRMSDKLNGKDYMLDGVPSDNAECESIEDQVTRLIQQATSHERLCQSYIGWCPFW